MDEINENVIIDNSSTITVEETYIPYVEDITIQNTEEQSLASTPTSSTSVTPTPSTTVTPTSSTSITPTSSTTATPTPSASATPTSSTTATPTSSASVTPTPSVTTTPTASTSVTPTPSATPTPSTSVDPTPSATVTPSATPITHATTQSQNVPALTIAPTRFLVNSKPSIIKYTGGERITIKIGKIYSAASAYVIPRNYHLSNRFGVFNDNNDYTSNDFTYFNVMKTQDSNSPYSYNIFLKTSPNLYPSTNNETIAGTTNQIPPKYIVQYQNWTYTWNSISITPTLINNGRYPDIVCNTIDSPVFEVRQKQNNISLPGLHTISFYGNTRIYDYNIGPVVIEPINSYSDTVIAKITKVSSNNILSFSNGASSISVKRGGDISVRRHTSSNSGWAYIEITSGDKTLTPSFSNPISYTCVVNLQYLGQVDPDTIPHNKVEVRVLYADATDSIASITPTMAKNMATNARKFTSSIITTTSLDNEYIEFYSYTYIAQGLPPMSAIIGSSTQDAPAPPLYPKKVQYRYKSGTVWSDVNYASDPIKQFTQGGYNYFFILNNVARDKVYRVRFTTNNPNYGVIPIPEPTEPATTQKPPTSTPT